MFARLTIDLIRRPSVTEVQSQGLGNSAFESVIEIIFRTQSTVFQALVENLGLRRWSRR